MILETFQTIDFIDTCAREFEYKHVKMLFLGTDYIFQISAMPNKNLVQHTQLFVVVVGHFYAIIL